MIAWHGSPALFDRFDAGSISPAQSEGFGIYVTEHRDIACHYATPGVWRQSGAPRCGYVYEVEAPDGEYIDNSKFFDEQPAVVRAILLDAVDRLAGPMAGYWRFVIAAAPSQYPQYTQVGKTLSFARKNGTPVEPSLIAAGFAGFKLITDVMNEYVIVDPAVLKVRSVAPVEERMAA